MQTAAAEDDERYASQRAVCMAAHRMLWTSPVLGLGCRLGKHCVPVLEIPFLQQDRHQRHDEDEKNFLYAWKGLNSIYVTLMKHDQHATAIYVHPSDMHYNASELGSLGNGCPTGTALLAQVVLDRSGRQCPEGGAWGISVNIFDALQIGADDFVQLQLPPTERYRRLRALCTHTPNVLTSPVMKLQWAGEYGALKNFCSGPGSHGNIDHIPDGYFRYTRKHPCKIIVVE